MAHKDEFMDRVQAHERAWGEEMYPGRPALSKILIAPVVVFWRPVDRRGKLGDRWIISLHADMKDIETWFLKAFTRMHLHRPDRQFVACYHMHKKMRIKGIRIAFEPVEAEE